MKHVIGLALLLVCTSATAIPVKWTLEDAIFDDGTELTGSFVYDADTNQTTSIDIRTVDGLSMWGGQYTSCVGAWRKDYAGDDDSDAMDCGTASTVAVMKRTDLDWSDVFNSFIGLFFDEQMTNMREVISLDLKRTDGEINYSFDVTSRQLVSGQISSVPVPAAVWLFGSGLGLLGWMRRKATV